MKVLVINSGSSSLKYQLYEMSWTPHCTWRRMVSLSDIN